MELTKKYFVLLIVILYIIGVLALIGAFLIIKINNNEPIILNNIIIKALIVGVPPLLYPLYKIIKKK